MAGRGYCCAVTVMGTLATVCFLVSFIMPAWIVLNRRMKVEEIDVNMAMSIFMRQELQKEINMMDDIIQDPLPVNMMDDIIQDPLPEGLIDEGMPGLMPPSVDGTVPDPNEEPTEDGFPDEPGSDWQPGDMDWEVRYPDGESVPVEDDVDRHHRPPHHHHHHHHSESSDMSEPDYGPTDMNELEMGRSDHRDHHCEKKLEKWAANSFGMTELINGFAMKTLHIHASYGLWFSRYCAKTHDDTEDMMGIPHRKQKDSCSCVTVETGCALKYAIVFDKSPVMSMMTDSRSKGLSGRHMGGASLKEHRIESAIGVAFCLIGLIAGIVGFKKTNGCRCMKAVSAVAMLIALTLFLAPSIRLAKYSHYMTVQDDGVDVHFPFSVLAAFLGCVFAFTTFILAVVGVARKYRPESAGKWYKFNNELVADVTSDVKKPSLVFLTEPLPEKPGLYDVCDFDDVKLANESEEPGNEAIA